MTDNHFEPLDKLIFKTFFFFFGFSVNVVHSVLMSATQDIFEETDISSSLNVILLNAPYLVVALILPYFVKRMTPFCFAVSTFVSFEFSLGLSIFSRNNLQLIGLALISLASGIAEVGFFSSSICNLDTGVHFYSFGAGAGLCGGTLFYTGKTVYIF